MTLTVRSWIVRALCLAAAGVTGLAAWQCLQLATGAALRDVMNYFIVAGTGIAAAGLWLMVLMARVLLRTTSSNDPSRGRLNATTHAGLTPAEAFASFDALDAHFAANARGRLLVRAAATAFVRQRYPSASGTAETTEPLPTGSPEKQLSNKIPPAPLLP